MPAERENSGERSRFQKFIKELWAFRQTGIILFIPILLLPMVLVSPNDRALKCGYATLIMAIYWSTEALPLAVTALLPMVLFPLLGVLGAKEVCVNYLKDANVLFMAGLIVAVAIEDCNLHKRIALRVLTLVGSKPKWLMFGFMITTAFLSMWISNTATTAMMVPIAQAVLSELEKHQNQAADSDDTDKPEAFALLTSEEKVAARNGTSATQVEDAVKQDPIIPVDNLDIERSNKLEAKSDLKSPKKKDFDRLCKGLTICVCYAANIGGTATLTGTGPNMIFKGVIDSKSDSQSGITFASWMVFAFPNMLICLLITWLWLQFFFLGWRQLFGCCLKDRKSDDIANQVIRQEYAKLGTMTFAEIAVLCHFVALAVLWMTRDPEFIDGWSSLFEDKFVTDSSTGMIIVMSLFVFPSRRPNFFCCRANDDDSPSGPVLPILTWKKVQKNLPWDVVILLGGGFALANGAQESGLSKWLGEQMSGLGSMPPWTVIFIMTLLVAGITEFTSNISTNTIFLPIVGDLAISMGVNPLYFMIPVTVATSFAFMLPVATPPNAIVFSYGHLKVKDMISAGFFLNITCILVLQLAVNTWGYAFFGFGAFPDWAIPTNKTTVAKTMINCINGTAKV